MTAKRTKGKSPTRKARRRHTARNERFSLFAASLLISANICLFGTFEIFSSNRSEFDVAFGDMLPGALVICLGVAAILGLAGVLIPTRFRKKFVAVLLTLGILIWIEGSFIRWGYGEFDGTGIDWAAFSWQGWVDALIWITPLVAAVRFSKRISQHALFIALTLMLLQSGVLVVRATTHAGDAAGSHQSKDADEKPKVVPPALCQLSRSRNVFHFIMDAFQTNVFMELVEEEGLAESLDGFVVYRRNISSASQTLLSVPALFSTYVYDGSVAESEYFRRALDASFHTVLFEEKFVVNLMPHTTMKAAASTNYFDPPSPYAAPHRTRMLRSLTYLVDISLFRHVPHFCKRVVFNDQNWRLSGIVGEPPTHMSFHHKAFLRDYIDKLEAVYSRPAYHFAHVMPPHGPFVTLKDGSYAGKVLPNTWENYRNEARYMLRLFVEFLEKLRELGLYDSSIVILHGDHGTALSPGNNPTARDIQVSSVSALLLVKPPSARGPLRSSWAQTSLTDIPATVMDLLGIPHSYPGESIVKLDAATNRSRPVVFLTGKATREPVVSRWVVRGNVEDSTSWHQLESRKVARRIHKYEWGTPLRFGVAHEGDVYLTSGWSTTSTNYSWNNGPSAEMIFGIDPPARDVECQITLFAYIVPGKVDRQRIHIRVNGVKVSENVLTDGQVRATWFKIPREVLQTDRLVVAFDLPDAVVPREIGEGRDSRALAVGLFAFEARLVPDGQSR